MKIAEFIDPKYDFLRMIYTEAEGHATTLIRSTEWLDITFTPRAPEEMVPEAVAAVDADIAIVTEKFATALQLLKEKRSNLLALTQQKDSV